MKNVLLLLFFCVVFVKTDDLRHVITRLQSVTLGQQFNALNGELLNHHVWTPETIERFKIDCSKDISENKYRVEISNGNSDTLSKLGVSAYVKISIASGLIDVSGSASFMKSNKRHTKSSFLFASQSVRNGCVRFDSTNYGNPDVSRFNDHATHVVTEIIYGGDATLTFERKLESSEDEQKISGKLDLAIKKFPGIDIGGGGELHLTDEEKKLLESIKIEFSGDFAIQHPPTDYNQAIALVQKFGEGLKNVRVPKAIILTPIKYIQSRLNRVYHDIEAHIVEQFSQRLELKMRLDNVFDELLEFKPFINFRHSINEMKSKWVAHTTKFLDEAKILIKDIRARKRSVGELTKLLSDSTEQGIYTFSRVETWLIRREREVAFLSKIMNDFKVRKIEKGSLKSSSLNSDNIEFYFSFNNVITPGIMDLTSTFIPRANSRFSDTIYYYMRLNHLKLKLFYDDDTTLGGAVKEISSIIHKKTAWKTIPINLFEMHYMFEGEIRGIKDYLISENGEYYSGIPDSFGTERKFVVNRINEHGNDAEVWSAKFNATINGGEMYMILKEDGNLIVENRHNGRSRVVWESRTNGKGKTPFSLLLTTKGELILEDYDWNVVWSSAGSKSRQSVDFFDNLLIDLNYRK